MVCAAASVVVNPSRCVTWKPTWSALNSANATLTGTTSSRLGRAAAHANSSANAR